LAHGTGIDHVTSGRFQLQRNGFSLSDRAIFRAEAIRAGAVGKKSTLQVSVTEKSKGNGNGKQRHQRVGHRAPLVPDLDTWAGKSDGETKARAAMLDGLAQFVFSAVVSGWVGKHFRREAPGRDDVTTVTQTNAQLLWIYKRAALTRPARLGECGGRGIGARQPSNRIARAIELGTDSVADQAGWADNKDTHEKDLQRS